MTWRLRRALRALDQGFDSTNVLLIETNATDGSQAARTYGVRLP
jgi:hypothetical protein